MENCLPDILHRILKDRPPPHSQFDQVHMVPADCHSHALDLAELVAGRDMLFVGDSDCVSLAILVIDKELGISPPRTITVLDFDIRVLNYLQKWGRILDEMGKRVLTRTYNVLYPSPNDLAVRPDFFHVNPPFGSMNGGQSATVWFHRAADMCSDTCSGCIVLADNISRNWCAKALEQVRDQTHALGFSKLVPLHTRHAYDSPWDSSLRSRGYISSRTHRICSPLHGRSVPLELQATLYGDPVEIPALIHGIT